MFISGCCWSSSLVQESTSRNRNPLFPLALGFCDCGFNYHSIFQEPNPRDIVGVTVFLYRFLVPPFFPTSTHDRVPQSVQSSPVYLFGRDLGNKPVGFNRVKSLVCFLQFPCAQSHHCSNAVQGNKKTIRSVHPSSISLNWHGSDSILCTQQKNWWWGVGWGAVGIDILSPLIKKVGRGNVPLFPTHQRPFGLELHTQ